MPTTLFPTLSSGSMKVDSSLNSNPIAMYPMNSTTSWATRAIRFVNDTEQSWTVRPKLFSCQLSYTNVNGYDAARVADFFHQQKGMWVDDALLNVFSITINGTTYGSCVFDQDDIALEEKPNCPGRFSFTLNIRQLRTDIVIDEIVSAVLSVDHERPAGETISPIAIGKENSTNWISPTGGVSLPGGSSWARRTDTTSFPIVSGRLRGEYVMLTFWTSLNLGGMSQWLVYDVWVDVLRQSGATGVIRPTSYYIIPGSFGGDGTNEILDPLNAMDGDSATFSTFNTRHTAPLGDPTELVLTF